MKVTIVLADDHEVMRNGLRALLERNGEYTVAGEAETGRQALRMVRDLGPDIVVMDIGMPDLNGIEATRQIKAEFPHVRVVALSMHKERRFVTGMLEAGASAAARWRPGPPGCRQRCGGVRSRRAGGSHQPRRHLAGGAGGTNGGDPVLADSSLRHSRRR